MRRTSISRAGNSFSLRKILVDVYRVVPSSSNKFWHLQGKQKKEQIFIIILTSLNIPHFIPSCLFVYFHLPLVFCFERNLGRNWIHIFGSFLGARYPMRSPYAMSCWKMLTMRGGSWEIRTLRFAWVEFWDGNNNNNNNSNNNNNNNNKVTR